jgi:hypothetical protein
MTWHTTGIGEAQYKTPAGDVVGLVRLHPGATRYSAYVAREESNGTAWRGVARDSDFEVAKARVEACYAAHQRRRAPGHE